ncbi:siderophore-dependent iron transporter [Penicillium capsulatum]|uniref:Siderophore-dependent iron transporter n=1 Tax=Penicillium capsulatum TaxID=69766 RepID=A0A9W9LMR1_9EURO|nr:siderophore-dependent iron transporter [Penicillium capsulatum]KAJ6108841.1 siderophore-dependent iron transporter [Penicillium capsulatum]
MGKMGLPRDSSAEDQIETNTIRPKSEAMTGQQLPDDVAHGPTQAGVSKVEAFNRVLYHAGPSGKMLLLTLVVSIGLTMFAYALDQGITSQFNTMATSSFSMHAELGAVNTASQIIRAISKPFIGKLADITSRPTTYLVVLVFYAIGFAVAASCTNLAAYTVGISFTAFGKSGLDLLGDIIVGDLTTLQWRAFWGGMLSTPFLVTTFVNGFIADSFIPEKWRWGLGMFAIMMPVLLIPAICTLYGMQRKAEKVGMISMGDSGNARRDGEKIHGVSSYAKFAWEGVIEIDLAGLILLGMAFSLILLPFTLAKSAHGGWSNPSMIAMLVVGFVILLAFLAFEIFLAPKPIMTQRILTNKAFLAALVVDVFNQMASSTRNTFLSSYVYVIKDWSNYVWTVFLGTTTLCLCLFSPLGGLLHAKTHRYKTLMLIGAVLKLIGYSILMKSHNRSTEDTGALVASQILLGTGALTVIGARVGSQASVPHEHMATVISSLSLWSTLGSSVGSTISSAIWTDKMLDFMREECPPDTPESTLKSIYGSIKILRKKYQWNDPIRQGTIHYYLGKQQNAVTNTGLDGEPVHVPQRENEDSKGALWDKLKGTYLKEK